MPPKPPVLPGSSLPEESPADRALQLALAGERDAALRWAAAILRDDPGMPTALCLTGRLLGEGGREEAARESCTTATRRAIDMENLPLAVTAAREAARFGADLGALLDEIAESFCKDSPRHGKGATPPVILPPAASFTPLPSVLTGVGLNNKACEIVHEATRKHGESARPLIGNVPLFSTLDQQGLRELVEALEPQWLQAGHRVIEQGTPGKEAYWVARGELEATRTGKNGKAISLAHLRGGSVFGEMALLSRSPRSGTVITLRPTIVVRIAKDKLDRVAQAHPGIAVQLGTYCRDRMVQNLLKTSDVLRVVPEKDLPALVSRFKIVCFEQSDRLVVQDEFPTGLFLIASGEVAIVRREGDGDPLVLKTLGVGDVVGEVATILRRKTSADVLATHPSVTLFLPTGDLLDLVRRHPAILAELYLIAVQRDDETKMILDEETEMAEDVDLS
ncbi:MAG: cyclic nucleotide-binding domain-containing protein [Polyangiaceae bacterium]|nr:cyclic nucleotide-binding domain-containing protein [Polyangiaceae bacterium]